MILRDGSLIIWFVLLVSPRGAVESNDGQGSEQWTRTLERLHQRQGNVGRLVNELVEDFKKAQEQAGGSPGAGEEPSDGNPEGVEENGTEAGEDAEE